MARTKKSRKRSGRAAKIIICLLLVAAVMSIITIMLREERAAPLTGTSLLVMAQDGTILDSYEGEIVIVKAPGSVGSDDFSKGGRTAIFTVNGEEIRLEMPDGSNLVLPETK